jgi:hypothetical protein
MKFNKDMIQWKKDKKKNAEDPGKAVERRKKSILSELKHVGEPMEERELYRAIRHNFKTRQDFFLMLQGLVKDKCVGALPSCSEHRRRRYFIKDKGVKILS